MEIRSFLKNLSVPQLREMRRIFTKGVPAEAEKRSKYADADGGRTVKRLTAENEKLKHEKQWRDIVESYNLEFDDPKYWLSFATEDSLRWVCNKLANAKTEAALAQATKNSVRVPALTSTIDLDPVAIVREGFKNRRNGDD